MRWRTALTPQFVTGIIVLEVQKNANRRASQKWLIKTVYSEFNSGMYLEALPFWGQLANINKVHGSSTLTSSPHRSAHRRHHPVSAAAATAAPTAPPRAPSSGAT